MVNFVSIFCPEHQRLLKPIYDLTRKGGQFIWGEEQQKAFDEIKQRLQRPQSYIYPTDMDDSNCIQTLASLPLVACCTKFRMDSQGSLLYASKRMPEAAKNYSITELEMCRLAMNIVTFLHLLKKVDFDAVVDHLAITHIMRSKAEPATI